MLPEHLLCGRLEVGAKDEQLMVPALSDGARHLGGQRHSAAGE